MKTVIVTCLLYTSMPNEEYDLAGFTVGIGEKDKLVSGDKLASGNALIGVASSGCLLYTSLQMQ